MDFCPQDTNLHPAFQLSIWFGASTALSNQICRMLSNRSGKVRSLSVAEGSEYTQQCHFDCAQ